MLRMDLTAHGHCNHATIQNSSSASAPVSITVNLTHSRVNRKGSFNHGKPVGVSVRRLCCLLIWGGPTMGRANPWSGEPGSVSK